ncbi:MAG: DUF456 family protein [Candidatus Sericytochromatia bacterium]
MIYLLCLILLAALACLILFQTNRSIYVRSLGLFLILAAELIKEFQIGNINPLLITAMGLMLVLGFASDYYSASLRTWYFRVSDQAVWGLVIGGFIGIVLSVVFPTLLPFLFGSLLGALIGEIRARGFRSAAQISKATLGTFAGVFGMSVKLLLGIEMVYWFVMFIPPSTVRQRPLAEHTEAAYQAPATPGLFRGASSACSADTSHPVPGWLSHQV